MRRILWVLVFFLGLSIKADAQGFLRAYGNNEDNYLLWSKYSEHYDCFYLFGYTGDIPYVSRVDRNGNLVWTRYYQQGFSPADVDELPVEGQDDPDIVICFSKFGSFSDIHVMRLNAENGEVIWSYEYWPQSGVRFPHLIISSDNKIIISGINFGNSGMVFAKLDVDGNILWSKRYTSNISSTFASGGNMIRDYNGGALTSFIMDQAASGVFSVDADGNLATIRQANIFHIFRDLALAKEGYLIATILDWNARGRDHGVVKLGLDFNVNWAKRVNPAMTTPSSCDACGLPSVGEAPNGEVFYVQDSYLPGFLAFSLLRFSKTGNLFKSRSFQKADVALQALRSVSGEQLSVIGATTRTGLCIPGSQNGLFGLFNEDLDICEVIDINPVVEDVPLVFSPMAANVLTISDHPIQRNASGTVSTIVNFVQTQFCEEEDDFIDLGPDTTICQGASIVLNAGSGYSSYLWSTGATTPTINVNSSGIYSIIVTTVCGTTLRDTIQIFTKREIAVNNNVSICSGASYTVGNSVYNTPGLYVDTILNDAGCDTIVFTQLTVRDPIAVTINAELCDGDFIELGTTAYNSTGTHVEVLTSQAGCDSTVTLNLFVKPIRVSELKESICDGTSFSVGNQSVDSSGSYAIIIPAFDGCDSTVFLDLTVLSAPTRSISAVICQGQSITIGNQEFSENGDYKVLLPAPFGCDSVITLELRVEVAVEQVLNPLICIGEQFEVGNQIFTEEGQYVVILSDSKGCDSILRVNLQVLLPSDNELQVTICDGQSYTVGSNTYNSSGTYTDSLLNIAGCDSIITTILSVAERYEQQEEATICRGETFLWNGQTISVAGEYQAALRSVSGCDSIVTLLLTVSDLPIINAFASADYIYLGEQVILTATPSNNNLNYSWSPPELILNPGESVSQALPIQDTWFIISVRDNESDCLGSDSVFVQVFDDCSISLPTAFSPNGDGINDCYRVLGRPGYSNFNLSIFNRWSELVYRSDSPDSCWDGSFEGAPAPMDNYIVHIAYTCNEDKSVSKSSVLLLVR
jgi:gliding motility-associated-like protein